MNGSTPIARWRDAVTRETTGGVLLLGAAAIALVWANSPFYEIYRDLSDWVIGPSALHLDLSLATWAADGLLAIFFFVVGLELKHEIVAGSLRHPRSAAVPVLAAVGGMAVPAVIYVVLINALGDSGAMHGWATPTATDIAFALAVLAVFGRGLPRAVRTFLLTLAVVDDLLAIIIIAVFYTADLNLPLLGAALVVIAVFGFIARTRGARWWMLLPLALIAWTLMHASGVHATIAGVVMGLTVPALKIHGEEHSRTHSYEHTVRPISAGIALPLFAFFAAGVSLVESEEGPLEILGQPVVAAITVGLVLGKLVGVLGTTALLVKLTPLRLADEVGLRDMIPVGFLCGIGFTVSLLISELSFSDGEHTAGAKIAILIGSLTAAALAAITLRIESKRLRSDDMNEDGRPDIQGADIGDKGWNDLDD